MLARSNVIHKFIVDDITILGANKKACLANFSLWLTPVIGLGLSFTIIFPIIFHILVIFLTNQDKQFFEIMLKTKYHRKKYLPWPQENIAINKRPYGFGRDTLC
ncbi:MULTISPECIES: VirB3 family type IV secretion system protein [Candidatus Ichthyocystis]|uniref:VirB3 family type IV secretion system protein n=1 Tax=Candidatus Ichthyocystis TaxID=2929841 RepID=UPI000B864CAA|nr:MULTISPECIES: VirB3 family type IV secretion system protein [Ichthyocystis]